MIYLGKDKYFGIFVCGVYSIRYRMWFGMWYVFNYICWINGRLLDLEVLEVYNEG